MAFPYSSGDVLTAADLNQSSGLVFIKSQTIGTAVSSVTVTNAFSSTFDNYRVSIDGVASSAGTNMMIALGTSLTGSGYYGSFLYDNYAGPALGTARLVNASNLYLGAFGVLSENFYKVEITNPFVSDRTGFATTSYGSSASGWSNGTNASSSSFTAFTIGGQSGTMTGGTIRVYGYNNG